MVINNNGRELLLPVGACAESGDGLEGYGSNDLAADSLTWYVNGGGGGPQKQKNTQKKKKKKKKKDLVSDQKEALENQLQKPYSPVPTKALRVDDTAHAVLSFKVILVKLNS